jgi:alpha-2-macroglobulin
VHTFNVQDFRRPEFEVVTTNDTALLAGTQPGSPGVVLSTQPATVSLKASYYAGGPLTDSPVSWQVTTADTSYSPPGWDQFTFGKWIPWWLRFGDDQGFERFPGQVARVETFIGVTGSDGVHRLQLNFAGANGALPDLPKVVDARGAVTDVNRQELSSSTTLTVHPSKLYVGLRSARPFIREGEDFTIEAITTDIDGKPVTGQAYVVSIGRVNWKYSKGTWSEELVDIQTCDATSTDKAVPCTFKTEVGGTYRATAAITDEAGGRNRSELTLWVTGGTSKPSRELQRDDLTVVPDKRTYNPGDTAELFVQAPFKTGSGLITVSRSSITSTHQFTLQDGTAVVKIPITGDDIPNLSLFVEAVGQAERLGDDGQPLVNAVPRPAFAVAQINLEVSVATRTLVIAATPKEAALRPGARTSVDVVVTGPDGKPEVGSEFAIAVVDEAVLALSGYQTPNPLAIFYGPRYAQQQQILGRDSIVLANPDDVQPPVTQAAPVAAAEESEASAETTAAAAGAADFVAPAPAQARSKSLFAAQQPSGPIDDRTNLDALAVFSPTVITDTNGRATIDVPLPDNLTRYRVMVVAVGGDDRFGFTESSITARLPLSVRPSAPRFLNFGDRFELPIVVQNQTDEAMDVDVVVQTDNLSLTEGRGRRVRVPANDRIEVRFPAQTESAGTARFRVAAVAANRADGADATTISLPVFTPATAEAFATYGTIDETIDKLTSIEQPIVAPSDAFPQFGGLEITTSSTALQGLTDAVIALDDYPYDSADALAARVIAITALSDVLDQFKAPSFPGKAAYVARATEDVKTLVSLQRPDGGWSYWPGADRPDPWVTVQVAHALVAAKAAGIPVPNNGDDLALRDIQIIEERYPANYPELCKDTISAYALYVRNLAGDRDESKAAALWKRRGSEMPLEAAAWLWPLLTGAADTEIERRINNAAVETAGQTTFTTGYSDNEYLVLSSSRRSDAVILSALLTKRTYDQLNTKVATGLLADRAQGEWSGIQENSFVLVALKRYFEVFENQPPDFTSGVWLDNRYAGSQTFKGRSTDRLAVSVPMSELAEAAAKQRSIVINKTGTGRLYYRMGLRYAPTNLVSDPLDRGFTVLRTYEAVDNPADVRRDADGTWRIAAGAKVRVRITMVAESQRTRMALVDHLPAGLEILNPDLATTPPIPAEVSPDSDGVSGGGPTARRDLWWMPRWFDRQNLRDDRAEAFSTLLPAGIYDYSYVARATTPGTFVAPPTRAEEIYAPETFGRSGSTVVVIG